MAKESMFAVVYSDEGPNGPCGQSCITTSPHCSVYLFFSEEAMQQWLKDQQDNMDKRRKARRKASWKICYPEGHQDCNQLGMLVVP